MAEIRQHVVRKRPDGPIVVDKQNAQWCRGKLIST
jgi:hypothetical protein